MTKFYLIFLLFPLFYLVRRNAIFHAVIHYGNHTEIFNYLSNVTNFRVLNPTIISVTDWEWLNETNFYVNYKECLSQIPAVMNYAHAYYEIRHEVDGSHALISQHFTCFFTHFLCLSTNSALHVTKPTEDKVGYREEISYYCPWALSNFCFNEVAFQRSLITSKLTEIFSARGKTKFRQNLDLTKTTN